MSGLIEPAAPAGVDALAADGRIVRLRSVTTQDADALADLHARGSTESLRMRFFGVPGRGVLATEVARLVRPAGEDHEVVVAEQGGVLIGVASYERVPPTGSRAEFAVFVDESHHGRGIGTLLIEHLVARARHHGVTELYGEVMAGNAGMLQVAGDLSGRSPGRPGAGVVDVGLATTVDATTLAEADARDRVAEHASLRPLFAPASVAVVGADRDAGGVGRATLRSLVDFGFTGRVYAVNPHTTSVAGVACWPQLSAIGEPVDLAVVAVPAQAVSEVLTDAGAAGVGAVVVLSAGFAEIGEAGRQRQADLVRIARRHGMRVVGPNCVGVLNTDPAVRLAATFAPVLPAAGGLALASQSGAVGAAVLEHAARTGVGVSAFVSLGNKADVSGNDLLSYWYDDPATTAVALYLESFGNPRRFARIARALARRKPVIAVFSGRSVAPGPRGGAAAVGPGPVDSAVDSLCAQAGIVRTDHLGELLDAARMLTDQPLPEGARLGLVSNAAGVNLLAADAAAPAGLLVPRFSEPLRAELARLVEGAGNPLDLGAAATPEAFAAALDRVAGSGEVDALLIAVAASRANDIPAILAAAGAVADQHRQLPMAAVVLGAPAPTALGERRAPVFDLPERAVAALGKAARYAAWRREPLGEQPQLPGVATGPARATVRAALAQGAGWQPPARVAEILGHYGVPMLTTVTAVGEDEVADKCSTIAYPVAIKAADPLVVHKSDVGAVRLNVTDESGARAAYRAIAAALAVARPAVLIQPMAAGQVELVAGIVPDSWFGSLVMLGVGGGHAELFADQALGLVPITDRDAGRMWRSLRAAPLLTGYRGSPPVDTGSVEDLLLRLGRLAEEVPEVVELELNPVLVGPVGAMVVDARMRLVGVGGEVDAEVRHLNEPS
ncbi:MAG TPA: GNAT family N-acetyltransferase [Micromonosporaceae bacterium]